MKARPKFRHSGIRSKALIEWVESAAPFLFHDPAFESLPYVKILREAKVNPPDETDLWAYFDLCLSSHFASVGSFVPTDVDLAIREKLWSGVHDEATFQPMWARVLEFKGWDERPVSRRWVRLEPQDSLSGDPLSSHHLSGHQGEWFTIAVGAYATAKRIGAASLGEIREEIEAEVDREETAIDAYFGNFQGDPEAMKRCLSAIAAVAHNLGDLDRMIDAHEANGNGLNEQDPLRRRVYRSAHEDSRNPREGFLKAGRIYQALIAHENHRNFALREPKGLRKSASFLLPFGLFLDDWGSGLIDEGYRGGILTEGDLREIIEALVNGWKRLNAKSIYASQGYSRALVGIEKALGGREALFEKVTPAIRRDLEESGLRTLMKVAKEPFERKICSKFQQMLERPVP